MTDAMVTFLCLIKCVYFILTHPVLYQTKFYHQIPGTLSNKILSPDGLSLGCCFLFGSRVTDAMVTFIWFIKCVYLILTDPVVYQTKFYHQMTSHLGVAFLFGLRMTDAMVTFLWLIKCAYLILTHPVLYQ